MVSMIERGFGRVTVQLRVGDVVDQPDVDAVVNAANAQLRTGGGVAGAIHRAAGPGLAEECAPLAPIRPGEAVITDGHDLPNAHVIHCLGPVYGVDQPEDALLASCYRHALELADNHQLAGIVFPAISTGAFGYPIGAASRVALSTIIEQAPSLNHVEVIRIVLFSEGDLRIYQEALDEVGDS